jgi:hypothetical protein
MTTVQGALASATLGASLLLLAVGISTIVQLIRRGGFELGLAHVVADIKRRNVFLLGLCTSLVALFGLGFAGGIEGLVGASAGVKSLTGSVLFLVGTVGILILMANAFKTAPLSVQEEWSLREVAERASLASTPSVPVVPGGLGRGIGGIGGPDEPAGRGRPRP